MQNIKEVKIYKVANGYTVDIRGEKEGNPFAYETRIAPDLAAVKVLMDELFAV